jgi:hypothetical protein
MRQHAEQTTSVEPGVEDALNPVHGPGLSLLRQPRTHMAPYPQETKMKQRQQQQQQWQPLTNPLPQHPAAAAAAAAAAAIALTLMLGFFSLRKRPQPVMVPPVPTPLISTSTLPSVERQISGPERMHREDSRVQCSRTEAHSQPVGLIHMKARGCKHSCRLTQVKNSTSVMHCKRTTHRATA